MLNASLHETRATALDRGLRFAHPCARTAFGSPNSDRGSAIENRQSKFDNGDGGRGGIRTHGGFNPTFDFESSALNQLSHPSEAEQSCPKRGGNQRRISRSKPTQASAVEAVPSAAVPRCSVRCLSASGETRSPRHVFRSGERTLQRCASSPFRAPTSSPRACRRSPSSSLPARRALQTTP